VREFGGAARVGVLASGGLSHFAVDEALDRRVLDACRTRDADSLGTIPMERLNSGTSEIRNWIAAAGALEGLDTAWQDYVPCYRSLAGTGCGMGFAVWR
jgi:3-O-methylgallate 3,4-dioxygenase